MPYSHTDVSYPITSQNQHHMHETGIPFAHPMHTEDYKVLHAHSVIQQMQLTAFVEIMNE